MYIYIYIYIHLFAYYIELWLKMYFDTELQSEKFWKKTFLRGYNLKMAASPWDDKDLGVGGRGKGPKGIIEFRFPWLG